MSTPSISRSRRNAPFARASLSYVDPCQARTVLSGSGGAALEHAVGPEMRLPQSPLAAASLEDYAVSIGNDQASEPIVGIFRQGAARPIRRQADRVRRVGATLRLLGVGLVASARTRASDTR